MDVILVPGYWLRGASWDGIVPALERAGHRAHPLTLPGLGSADADRAGIGRADHVAAVVAAIDAAEGDVVLVGHSGGGALVHAAADARPDRVARVIYVDSGPAEAGRAAVPGFDPEGPDVPFPGWEVFEGADARDLDAPLRAEIERDMSPMPARVVTDPVELSATPPYGIPATIICSASPVEDIQQSMDDGEPMFAEAAKLEQVDWIDLPTGHWPQYSRPEELGRILVEELELMAEPEA